MTIQRLSEIRAAWSVKKPEKSGPVAKPVDSRCNSMSSAREIIEFEMDRRERARTRAIDMIVQCEDNPLREAQEELAAAMDGNGGDVIFWDEVVLMVELRQLRAQVWHSGIASAGWSAKSAK